MDDFAAITVLLATLALGLAAGALLAEAAVLVPFWRASHPEDFLAWYERYASLLLRFFGAIELASTLLIVLACALSWSTGGPGSGLLAASSGLTLSVLAAFPLYFQRANASFAERTIAVEAVAGELRRWALWHWGRTLVAIAAFAFAALALVQR